MADLLCHRSFFSCKGNTLNVWINNSNNNNYIVPGICYCKNNVRKAKIQNTAAFDTFLQTLYAPSCRRLLGAGRSVGSEVLLKTLKEKISKQKAPPTLTNTNTCSCTATSDCLEPSLEAFTPRSWQNRKISNRGFGSSIERITTVPGTMVAWVPTQKLDIGYTAVHEFYVYYRIGGTLHVRCKL